MAGVLKKSIHVEYWLQGALKHIIVHVWPWSGNKKSLSEVRLANKKNGSFLCKTFLIRVPELNFIVPSWLDFDTMCESKVFQHNHFTEEQKDQSWAVFQVESHGASLLLKPGGAAADFNGALDLEYSPTDPGRTNYQNPKCVLSWTLQCTARGGGGDSRNCL